MVYLKFYLIIVNMLILEQLLIYKVMKVLNGINMHLKVGGKKRDLDMFL